MRTLKIMLLASATTVVAFAAQAADAIYQAPEAPAAAESFSAPAGNWSGAYVGGGITYDFGKFTGSTDGRDAKGLGGTVYGGYNMQSGSIVYGGEADISYNGEDGSAGAGLTGTQGVNGSVRGRVGYDLNPFLVYGTAGVAVANHELKNGGDNDDDHLLEGNSDIAEMQYIADQRRDRLVARTLRDLDEVGQHDRHADRSDQRREAE